MYTTDIIYNIKMEIIDRTIKIFDALSANNGKMRFSDLAGEMDLPSPSTLTRLLKSLCDAGAIYKNEKGWYCLSSKPRLWGKASLAQLTLKEIVHPELIKINQNFKVSVIVFKYQHKNLMSCVDKIADENSPSLQNPGVLLPLNLGLIGSLIIKSECSINKDDFIADFKTQKDIDKLIEKFQEDYEKYGFIYDYGRLFEDNHRIAVPLKSTGKSFAVIGAGFTAGRLRQSGFIEKLADALKESALNIEKTIYEQGGDFKDEK